MPASPQPAITPARGPSVAPTNAYTEPECRKYWHSRTNTYATSSTPNAAMRNASGTARPAPAAPCGLMFAAMLGAISASDRPTACQTDSERVSPGSRVFWAGVVAIVTSQKCVRCLKCDGYLLAMEGARSPGG